MAALWIDEGAAMGTGVLIIAACVLAAAAAGLAGWWYAQRCRRENRARELKHAAGIEETETIHAFAGEGAARSVLEYLLKVQKRVSIQGDGSQGRAGEWLGAEHGPAALQEVIRHAKMKMHTLFVQAGLPEISEAACRQTTLRLAAMGAVAGALPGLMVSPAAACFMGVLGGIIGARAVRWAVTREVRARAEALSCELPEMLAVCALGLRSGLTFDRSFRLYPKYFGTSFAEDCRTAIERTEVGLASREDALMDLAAAYDSPLLERTLRGTVQALKRGTALADDLEATAEESRKQYRARKEEAVAKAPIRMMVPIGVLILPAMLLLVLGPVLLSLVQGL